MMPPVDPRTIQIADYTYALPDDRIALYPLPERDMSRLLVYEKGELEESTYRSIGNYLPAHSRLIFNNTRVVQARLQFKTAVGAQIEIFCLEPHRMEVATAMASRESQTWKCFVGRIKKWKEEILSTEIAGLVLNARVVENLGDAYLIQFSWSSPTPVSFSEILLQFGKIPIPPYLKRETENIDRTRYQTIYAVNEGSVAAPTAGLHFTEALLSELSKNDIDTAFLTLHVGAGTFKPVKTNILAQHNMHAEWMVVRKSFLEEILTDDRPLIPVGTTSMRTLESLYWMGVKAFHHPDWNWQQLEVKQWDAYEFTPVERKEAIDALLKKLTEENRDELNIQTEILIAPGYTPKMTSTLITNFHQPESTLILLVAACIGENWRQLYQYALDHNFRFLSYGDGCLLKF